MKRKKKQKFNTRNYIIYAAVALIVVVSVLSYSSNNNAGSNEGASKVYNAGKTPDEYYQMFQCSCCGKPIDSGCCGMAKQRKDYLDSMMNQGMMEEEIVSMMVKKFGFEVLMDPSMEEGVRNYISANAAEDSPAIWIEDDSYDFGIVKQSDGIVSTTFTISNKGKSGLVIEGIETSCMCTTASLVYDGKESPEFGMSMHGKNPEKFSLSISPGRSAELKVKYDPNAHGKQKEEAMKIKREVYITSNDPVDFRKKIRIELTQQR